jgi:hypothetical protein
MTALSCGRIFSDLSVCKVRSFGEELAHRKPLESDLVDYLFLCDFRDSDSQKISLNELLASLSWNIKAYRLSGSAKVPIGSSDFPSRKQTVLFCLLIWYSYCRMRYRTSTKIFGLVQRFAFRHQLMLYFQQLSRVCFYYGFTARCCRQIHMITIMLLKSTFSLYC